MATNQQGNNTFGKVPLVVHSQFEKMKIIHLEEEQVLFAILRKINMNTLKNEE